MQSFFCSFHFCIGPGDVAAQHVVYLVAGLGKFCCGGSASTAAAAVDGKRSALGICSLYLCHEVSAVPIDVHSIDKMAVYVFIRSPYINYDYPLFLNLFCKGGNIEIGACRR